MGLFDTLVLPEAIACAQCGTAIQSTQTKTLGNTLDTFRVGDEAEAERNLLAVDRADLLYYLSAHQRECRRVRRLLRQALAVVQSYADYTASEDKEAFLAEPFGFLTRSDLKEHLAAAAPLKSIVDEYQRRLGRTDEDDGWP